MIPWPLQDYFGLFSAPLAEAEELVSGTTSLGEKLAAPGHQLLVAVEQPGICPPQLFDSRCVDGVMAWQFLDKVLELLWWKKTT